MPSSINSSCEGPWESVPIEIRHPSLGDREEIDVEILTVRITVNFNSFIELCCQSEDPLPVGVQAKAEVVNAVSGMT